MKLKAFLISCMATLSLGATVPGSFMMQAVATDGNATLANKDVAVRVSLRQGKADAKNIYVETHNVTTDGLGVITLRVGEGSASTGDFGAISWSGKTSFIEIEIDKGEGYVSAGTQQIAAVPYAKVAEKAEALTLTSASGKKFTVNIDDDGNLVATPVAE